MKNNHTIVYSLWNYAKTFFLNIKNKFFYKISLSEIELIKNTLIFRNVNENILREMILSVRPVRYLPGKYICQEGKRGDSLFIIVKGSVLAFTFDQEKKIPLARLNVGDYFGEQALLGQASRSRNANIEAITDTTVLKIHEKYLTSILNVNLPLKNELKKAANQQALHMLSESNEFYKDIESLQQNADLEILEFKNEDVIFRQGDSANAAYIILQGEVKLLIRDVQTQNITELLMYKNQLFGEVGVLENKPRAATAIVNSDVLRLLTVPGEKFKQHASTQHEFQKMLAKLKRGYQFPMKGNVQQYIGQVNHMGNTITNIYKIEDGRTIISLRSLNQDIFTMVTQNIVGEKKIYEYKEGENSLQITIKDKVLVGINAYGMWDNLPDFCQFMLDKEIIEDDLLIDFEQTGIIKLKNLAVKSDIICNCMSVTRNELQKLINEGIRNFDDLSKETGACTSCGSCAYKILEMLDENPWLTVVIKKIIENNSFINSYSLKPINTKFKLSQPGQHVILQVKIGNHWIERPYTISGIGSDGSLRISVKKETQGFFTQWLFQNLQDELEISVSQPQGGFVLNTEVTPPVVCFAGGIGITPFIRFAQFLAEMQIEKKMLIIYSATNENDFIFKNEFTTITHQSPSIEVRFRATTVEGSLTEKEILEIIRRLHDPDVYICGPPGFTEMIKAALYSVQYNHDKIYIEKFVHAGSAV